MEIQDGFGTFSQTAINSVKRYKHQATYDAATIYSIINTCPVLHVSFIPDPSTPLPIILPMIGRVGRYPGDTFASPDESLCCYLHGYVSSRLMKLGSTPGGLPVCVAATLVDGLVLSLTPNSHNYNYRSAILHGTAELVTSHEETLWAMELITNSVVPDRWAHTRIPPDGAEMQSTRIMRVRVDTASAKVREGVPQDERKDLKREDVLDSVWTGVVPMSLQFGDPVPGPYNRVVEVPTHVKKFIEESNRDGETYSIEAALKPAPEKRKSRKGEMHGARN